MDKSKLVLDHLYLAHVIAKAMMRTFRPVHNDMDVSDLTQIGSIGLMDAAERFDDTMGCSFKTFARRRIVGQILDAIRQNEKTRLVKPPLKRETIDMDDVIDEQQEDAAAAVKDRCQGLRPASVSLMVMRYAGGMTFAEIAAQTGHSPSSVAKRHQKIVQFLRKRASRLGGE